MLYFKCVMCVISEYFMAFFILKGEIFLKKQDFKRQLAAIMALAVTFSSVPLYGRTRSLSLQMMT